jgi:hypothetical protein
MFSPRGSSQSMLDDRLDLSAIGEIEASSDVGASLA